MKIYSARNVKSKWNQNVIQNTADNNFKVKASDLKDNHC